nr:MAG TPA: hypothetical protein [Caudoviricetes sp.]
MRVFKYRTNTCIAIYINQKSHCQAILFAIN